MPFIPGVTDDVMYFGIIILSMILGLATQAYIRSSYNKWSKVPVSTQVTGAQAARNMLDNAGLHHVRVEQVAGQLTDHFDPRANVLRLSEGVYDGRSVAATAVANHEAGHAIQHAAGYGPAKLRAAIVPLAQFGSQMWVFLLVLGIAMNMTGLITAAIVLFAFAVGFQIVTLPVEFNASNRALAAFAQQTGGQPGSTEYAGAKQVLTAAALTYVAAALVSVLQLLYLLGRRD